jgi:predicted peptidase
MNFSPLLVTLLGSLALVAAPLGRTGSPQEPAPTTGFLDRQIRLGEQDFRFVVYVPPSYDPADRWPVIMFLHGRGECGTDGLKQVGQGLGRAIMNDRARWPFIVVFPQKPDPEKTWLDYDAIVMGSLKETEREFSTDPARTYLTGLSQGGLGTWEIGAAHPQRWAALVPICGFGDPDAIAPRVKDLPIRCYHGGADNVVGPEQSRRIIEALKAHGAQPAYTEFEGVNHNSWDRAYAEPDLPAWLLSHHK